jgi:hypothetical protein
MLCDACRKAMEISQDRFQTKELHDKCSVLIHANGQTERCSCVCQVNTIPPFSLVAELEGEDAEAFLQYNARDLKDKEIKSLEEAYELYKKHHK